MHFVRVLLLVVEALSAVLLIGLILLQKSKSEGLGMAFGGGAGEALFGARAGNVLSKMTVGLSVTFLVTTVFLAVSYSGEQDQSLVEQSISKMPAATQTVESAPLVQPEAPAALPAAE